MDTSPTSQTLEDMKRLLARTPVIRGSCELDLLVFLHRHPRSLLTNEQLAAFVGYEMKPVAGVIDAFIDAGLLERTQHPMHAARMYQLVLPGPQGNGLRELLELAATRQGRRNILEALGTGHSRSAPAPVVQESSRLQTIA